MKNLTFFKDWGFDKNVWAALFIIFILIAPLIFMEIFMDKAEQENKPAKTEMIIKE